MKKIIALCLALCTVLSLGVPALADAPNGYELSGTWKFNSLLTIPAGTIDEDVEFTCEVRSRDSYTNPFNAIYTTLSCHNIEVYKHTDGMSMYYTYDSIYGEGQHKSNVYGHGKYVMVAPWAGNDMLDNTEYITFVGTQTVSGEFYEWFIANATPYTVTDKVNTVLQYGMDINYIVTIPENIAMDASGMASSAVTITNAMLPSNQMLNVVLSGDSYENDAWHLTNAENGEKLQYIIETTDGALASGSVVLSATAGELWNTTKTSNLTVTMTDDITKAGNYTDTLTFIVSMDAMNVNINDDLNGSYKMLMTKPTVDTAIRVEFDDTIDNRFEERALMEQYGISVDSGAALFGDYYLTEITPWMYYINSNGEPVFFGLGRADNGLGNHGDYTEEELLYLYDPDSIPDDAAPCHLMVDFGIGMSLFFNQEFSISAETAATISDDVKAAFMASHKKIANATRNYFITEFMDAEGHNIRMNMYHGSWNSFINSDLNNQLESVLGMKFMSVDNMVYIRSGDTVAALTLNGKAVKTTDTILPRYEAHNQEYFNNIYHIDADMLMETCPTCGNSIFSSMICDEHGICILCLLNN